MPKRPKKTTRETLRGDPAPRSRDVKLGGPPAWVCGIVLAFCIVGVYSRAIDAPFIFDDTGAITRNESIVSIWPLIGTKYQRGPLNPAPELPTGARPLVNLSFALNYQVGGLNPIGYHAVNVLIHFCSAMLLWAIVRRTLLLPYFGERFTGSAGWLSLAVALIWALHPLQTEAVIYATQRTELMMAFFYLAALYCSLRYWSANSVVAGESRDDAPSRPAKTRASWLVLAVAACLCGMASKEVMVSAPLMILLYERTFIAGSLPKALRQSWPFYLGLAATWGILLGLSWSAPHREAAGFSVGVSLYSWWLTQIEIFLMYLKLVIWPWPLFLHYHLPSLTTFGEAWMYVVPVLLLGIAVLVLLWRNHPVGYLGTWVFAILAPTSVVPIITEMAAERRMYLPLAALIALLVVGGHLLIPWKRWPLLASRLIAVGLPLLLLVCGLGWATATRLEAYQEPVELWRQVVTAQPDNYYAHQNMGFQLAQDGDVSAAMHHYREAIHAYPDYALAHNSLGVLLIKTKAIPEAIAEFKEAVRIQPNHLAMRSNLARALIESGDLEQGLAEYRAMLQLDADHQAIHHELGNALATAGRFTEAIDEFKSALTFRHDDPVVLNGLARAYAQAGRYHEAAATARRALDVARSAGKDDEVRQIEQWLIKFGSSPPRGGSTTD